MQNVDIFLKFQCITYFYVRKYANPSIFSSLLPHIIPLYCKLKKSHSHLNCIIETEYNFFVKSIV